MTVVSIQYLRGVAASVVVAFHAGYLFGWEFGAGASGVDVFFVISGFIMWTVTSGRETSPRNFLLQRIARIVPLYWVLTLVFALAAFATPERVPGGPPSLDHLMQSLLFIPHVAPDGSDEPVMGQGWTLNYEMFFYLVFALALLLRRDVRIFGLSAAMIGLVIVGAITQPTLPVAHAYTSTLLLEFLAGVWLGEAWIQRKLPGLRLGLILIGLGLVAIAGSFLLTPFGLPRVVYWGLPAACIVAGAIALERLGKVPNLPFLKLLGDASYSIYLSHALSIIVCRYLLGKVGIQRQGLPLYEAVGVYVLVFAFCIGAGLLCYWLLERHLAKLFRGVGRRGVARLAPGVN